MHIRHIVATAALALACGSSAMARPANPESELAKALEGRVAGKPVDCIFLHTIRSSRIIDHTAIVYDSGRTIYVNRPTSGADTLSKWDIMLEKPTNSQLCSIDVVRLYDQSTRFPKGFVGLGKFVPYTKTSARD
ncbi:MAG TPA: hypothetical protein VJR87_03560 [Allosphingosinicella sp.]|nr:hypothetical protein [Allosphingosinicella sp.]HKT14462.1 hypothetical protein [Allosphingosinicella sp.]